MWSSRSLRAERCFHRCGFAVLLVSLVACADDTPVAPSAPSLPNSPTSPAPRPAPPGAPAAARLELSRTNVVFNAMVGATLSDTASITVSGPSAEALSGLRAVLRYNPQHQDWLEVAVDHSDPTTRLILRARSTPLPPGEYVASVQLLAPGAAPESLSVVARVATGKGIGINAAEICFTPTRTGPNARPDDVRITSLDGSPIDGLTATVIYDPGQPTGWLLASLTASSAPARLWLSSNMGVIPAGKYHATVQVASTTAGVAPVSIRVTLEVRPLQQAKLTLTLATVGLGGAGNGRLTAAGIDCVLANGVQSGDCEEAYAPGTVVHVAVLPSSGQVFYYLSGCPSGGPCGPDAFNVAMTEQERRVDGGFGAPPSTILAHIDWEGAAFGGVGIIEGPHGLRCPDDCSALLDGGVGDYAFTAIYAEYGAVFLRWEGACTGSGGCTVTFDAPGTTREVTAVFGTRPSHVSFVLRGDGASGSVTVSPAITGNNGIPFSCTLVAGVAQPGCSGTLAGAVGPLTLTAIPAAGSVFKGWEVTAWDPYDDTRSTCADPTSTTCVLTFTHGNSIIDGYVNFGPQ